MRRYEMVMVALLLLIAPVRGVTQDNQNNCDKNLGDTQMSACTLVIDDDAQSKSDRAVAYANRGDVLRVENDLELSLAYLDKAIRLDPDYGPAYLIRAFIWRDKSD